MKERPLVAVVTLNWNGADLMQECVDSILSSDYSNFRVIIVDNGSSDQSISLLRDLYSSDSLVTVLQNGANLGYSIGMNVGLKHAFEGLHAGHCLVMNNDTRLDPQAITALVDVAETLPQIAFVTGKVYYYDQPDTFQTVGKKSHPVLVNGGHIGRGEKDLGQYDLDQELAFCDDIFWLVSRSVYEKVGGYDPEFFLQAEDFDWQLRAKNAGYKIMYAHKAKLWHKESMAIGKKSPKKAYYDARNSTIAVMKNCESEVIRKYIKAKVFRVQLPAIIKRVAKGQLRIAFAMFSGLCSAMSWKIRHT